MATGTITRTQIDNDSMTFIAEMMEVKENLPVIPKLCDTVSLPNGYGLTYHEPYAGALTATTLTDGVEFDSPQQFTDTDVTYTLSEYGVQTLISKLTNDSVKSNLFRIAGRLMGNAMAYKLDRTGITQMQSYGASLGSGTATLVAGHITAAAASVRAGLAQSGGSARTGARATGDPAQSPIYAVIHEYQRRALAAQMSGVFGVASDATIGTTAPNMSFTSRQGGISDYQRMWLEQHYMGVFDGVRIYVDNNIPISSNAATGAVYARDSLVHVTWRTPNNYEEDTKDGRARRITLSDTWGWGTRVDVHGVALSCSAVTPTT